MGKADQLGASSSFAAAAGARSARRRLIDTATGADEATAPAVTPADPPRIVPLTDLAHNPFNPRADLGELQETADSLLEKGQIQPLTVITRKAFLQAHPGHEDELGNASYVVLDGNRRLGAARLAGLDEMRVDVNDALASSAADLLESALVANLHRADLTPLEEARTLAELVEVHGSQRQVARRIGKSNVWVSQRLALLDLKPELQEQLASGELKVEDARRIGKLPIEQQEGAAEEAKEVRKIPAPRAQTRAAKEAAAGEANRSVNAVNGGIGNKKQTVDWTDLVSLAAKLRGTLSIQQRKQLAELLLED
ncbi:ParB/RepB/Spo0J family partition protein [Actinomadura kijaniata]|uniref:ParB/RepB/Spo0J family partition protein n=1 Tax=Actinomadura kijaniata TaxID=46161 RepID=UPI00082F9C6E|nr:ParB/RepB/Spo0J family partition protein [Actinomadura kijaniata]